MLAGRKRVNGFLPLVPTDMSATQGCIDGCLKHHQQIRDVIAGENCILWLKGKRDRAMKWNLDD
ncbi:hypothetical protein HK13_11785 [Acetobacter indonesiensis]|nr:hypothetical protein HK13_11785 [Acetobacter indonesiensis]